MSIGALGGYQILLSFILSENIINIYSSYKYAIPLDHRKKCISMDSSQIYAYLQIIQRYAHTFGSHRDIHISLDPLKMQAYLYIIMMYAQIYFQILYMYVCTFRSHRGIYISLDHLKVRVCLYIPRDMCISLYHLEVRVYLYIIQRYSQVYLQDFHMRRSLDFFKICEQLQEICVYLKDLIIGCMFLASLCLFSRFFEKVTFGVFS